MGAFENIERIICARSEMEKKNDLQYSQNMENTMKFLLELESCLEVWIKLTCMHILNLLTQRHPVHNGSPNCYT